MEKITGSQFGKFDGFECSDVKRLKGGDDSDKKYLTGGGSGVHGMQFCIWEGDSYIVTGAGVTTPTSYGYTSKSECYAQL